jgi:hypothetical protein
VFTRKDTTGNTCVLDRDVPSTPLSLYTSNMAELLDDLEKKQIYVK